MRDAVVYDAEDIKKILAERHGVDTKDVIKTQYSYIVPVSKPTDGEGQHG